MSKKAFKFFKGLQGFVFKAVGRFARRGRALEFCLKSGLNYSRFHDIAADFSEYSFPLLFGIGNLQATFFYAERFYLRTYFRKYKNKVSPKFFLIMNLHKQIMNPVYRRENFLESIFPLIRKKFD
jgi:hypothetical protein